MADSVFVIQEDSDSNESPRIYDVLSTDSLSFGLSRYRPNYKVMHDYLYGNVNSTELRYESNLYNFLSTNLTWCLQMLRDSYIHDKEEEAVFVAFISKVREKMQSEKEVIEACLAQTQVYLENNGLSIKPVADLKESALNHLNEAASSHGTLAKDIERIARFAGYYQYSQELDLIALHVSLNNAFAEIHNVGYQVFDMIMQEFYAALQNSHSQLNDLLTLFDQNSIDEV